MMHLDHIDDLINGGNHITNQILLAFFSIDVLYNLLIEHPIQDNMMTKFIYQNVNEYLLTRNFLKDLALIIPFIM